MSNPSSNPSSNPTPTPRSPPKQKINVQLEWRKFLKDCPDFGYTTDEEGNIILYKWAHPWWDTLDIDGVGGLKAYIESWMSKNYPGPYGKNSIKSCVELTPEILVNTKPPLKKPDHIGIALDNHFLKVKYDLDDKPYIMVYELDKRTGRLMYNAARYMDGPESNVKQYLYDFRIRGLDVDRKRYEGGCYEPAPLQPGSKFYDMLHLAFDKRDIPDFQEFYGDLLTEKVRKAVPILIGEPDSGKSRWLGLFQMMVGAHNCAAANLSKMTSDFSLENWLGKRVILIDELPRNIPEETEALLKMCIGGSFVNVRKMWVGKNMNIQPRWKHLWASNHLPNFKEKSSAFNTRLRIFVVNSCPPEKRIEEVDRIIAETEKAIVLDWMLEGLLRIETRGRALRPDELSDRSQTHSRVSAREANPVISWIEEAEVTVDEMTWTPKDEIHGLFREWADQHGHKGFANVSSVVFFRDLFFRALDHHGYDTSWVRKEGNKLTVGGLRRICLPIRVSNAKNVMQVTAKMESKNILQMNLNEDKGGFKPEEIKVSNESPF